jgi:hypothetical protein
VDEHPRFAEKLLLDPDQERILTDTLVNETLKRQIAGVY